MTIHHLLRSIVRLRCLHAQAYYRGEDRRTQQLLLALLHCYHWLFDHNWAAQEGQEDAMFMLVFYSQAENGVILPVDLYEKLCRQMNREDLATHVALPISEQMIPDCDDIINSLGELEGIQDESA